MTEIKDAYLSTGEFQFQINKDGIVQCSLGPTHICMSLDSAMDLQYQLAAFLAQLELAEYSSQAEPVDDSKFIESQDELHKLARMTFGNEMLH